MDSALTAFQTTAGISAADLSLLIRTMFVALFLIWSGWIVYQVFMSAAYDELNMHHLIQNIFRVLILCSLVTAVAFIN